MTKKLTGQPSLPYLGVDAPQPPNITREIRRPLPHDCQNFTIGDLWLYHSDTPPQLDELWMYVRRYPNRQALWVLLWPGGGGAGTVVGVHAEAGDALPDALGYINIFGGDNLATAFKNMNTDADNVNTLHISLNKSIWQPATTADELSGVYGLNGIRFLMGYGTHNIFAGESSGNYTLDVAQAINNTALGFQSLVALTTGSNNLAVGDASLVALQNGTENVSLGHYAMRMSIDSSWCTAAGKEALGQILHGGTMVALGYQAGFNYNNAEANCIVIANPGDVGVSNQIKIGVEGVQDATYVAGIYHRNTVGAAGVVFCDSTGKLGTGADPANGSVLIGGTNGPQWAFLTAGAGIGIALGDHTITLTSGAIGGGLLTAHTDGGVGHDAVVDAFNAITWAGDGIIVTDGAANTVTISLPGTAVNGELLTSDGAGNTVWSSLVSGGGTVIITTPAPGTINLEAAAGGGITLTSDNATTANGANINVIGVEATLTNNIYTRGDNAATMTIFLKNAIILPPTNVAGTSGILAIGNVSPANDYFLSALGTRNTFLGSVAGNLTLTIANAIDNTAIGANSLQALVLGSQNTAAGSSSGSAITDGSRNCQFGFESSEHITTGGGNSSYGYQALNGVVSGNLNLALGYQSGSNFVGADSSNITLGHLGLGGVSNTMWLGWDGVGVGQVNAAYMGGVYNRTIGAVYGFMLMDNAFKMGTYNFLTDGTVTLAIDNVAHTFTFHAAGGGGGTVTGLRANDAAIALPAGGVINNYGGTSVGGLTTNINTRANLANTLSVCLNNSIWQPNANAAMTTGVYGLGGQRFLHNLGGNNIWLGYDSGNLALGAATFNVGIGYQVNPHMTTAANCVSIGYGAGHSLTTALGAISIGNNAGNLQTTSNYSIAIGSGALQSNVTSAASLAIGAHALEHCTGVGNHSIGYYSTAANVGGGGNTVYGYQALMHATAPLYNIIIGNNAASTYLTNEDNNIIIGSAGVVADGHTIRIGADGVGTQQQFATYVAGIYGRSYGNPHNVVMADSLGKLGTGGALPGNGEVLIGGTNGPEWNTITEGNGIDITNTSNHITIATYDIAFSARSPQVANATGDGTEYYFGSRAIMIEDYDNGGCFYIGSGAGANAYFQAPVAGLYYLHMHVYLNPIVAPPPPVPPPPVYTWDPLRIRVTGTWARVFTYDYVNFTYYPQAQSAFLNCIAKMSAGARAYFSIEVTLNPSTPAYYLMADDAEYGNSYCAGYLVKEGI